MDNFEISREDYKKLIELNKSMGQFDIKMLKYTEWFVKKYGIEEVERVRQEVLKEMKERQRIKNIEHNKKYRENNRDKINKNRREYYSKNKDTLNEKSKEYYNKNKDKIKAYREKHKEKIAKKD